MKQEKHHPCRRSTNPGAGPLRVLAACLIAHAASAATDEVRGTWLTTTGVEDHIQSGLNTRSVMEDLREIGLNTVYVETWKNGYTNFPSPTLAALTGGPDRSTFLGTTRDLVEETLIEAHRNEMNYIGWFEYGFSSQFIGSGGTPNNPLSTYMLNQGWLLQDQSGQYGNASNGFAWMNPAVPEVRQFLIDITLEAVERYDLDGVQFDDRLSWPIEFGWDATTAALYLQETGNSLPSSVNNTSFREWRQSKVTLFAEELTAAVDAVRPDLQLSVSPSITTFSDVNFNAEWPEWQDDGLFDEYAIQVYRDNFASFNAELTNQTAEFLPSDLDEFIVGLRGNGTGANTPYADLEDMIERSRQIGAAGHSIFYSKAVRDDYDAELTAFYDVAGEGHAANPFFGEDHRSTPVVGGAIGGDQWLFFPEVGGRYRIVARTGFTWEEVGTASIPAGLVFLDAPDAFEVELLIDRRPLESADFNGDGFIDLLDYLVWRETEGSTTDLRADRDNSGVIDQLDYDLWAFEFGAGTGSPSLSVPEPPSAALVASLLAAFSSGRRVRIARC